MALEPRAIVLTHFLPEFYSEEGVYFVTVVCLFLDGVWGRRLEEEEIAENGDLRIPDVVIAPAPYPRVDCCD